MEYTPMIDISELIKHEDVMEQYKFGPNEALIHCIMYLETHIDWLIKKILNFKDYYLIFDCPGQVRSMTYSLIFLFDGDTK